MDKIFVRNFFLFFLVLLLCSSILGFLLLRGGERFTQADQAVSHTHQVIAEAEQLANLIEGMLAAQRGYLLTSLDEFYEDFQAKKVEVYEHIARLSELTSSNKVQERRLADLRKSFDDFSLRLEQRAEKYQPRVNPIILENIEQLDSLKQSIVTLNNEILTDEYATLNQRVVGVEEQKDRYFGSLLVAVCLGTILLLVFNGFLLHVQQKRSAVEGELRASEERFILAIEGTQDGIFDWDIPADSVFYSQRFFSMLGYDQGAFRGTPEDFLQLVHPDDVGNVRQYIALYLDNELSEYAQTFRMRHKSGRYIWIQSRGKVVFNEHGKPLRFVGAHTDITYMKEYQERLKSDKRQAEEANRAKSDFLAHMSHEIRTPLTAISGIAEIFDKSKKSLPEKQQKLVATLYSSTTALKDLINDILDFSKIEGGELELDNKDFAPAELFEEVVDIMKMRAAEKDLDFTFDYDDVKGLSFYGDSPRLRQILVNLIGNSIKFTDEGGVFVKAYQENAGDRDNLRIDVRDTGIGIPEEHQDIIFERFKQGDTSVSRRYGGTGLGLPISKNLAKLMGGDILLTSEKGKGATFSVILPIHVRAGDAPVDRDESGGGARERLSDGGDGKILIVEDYEGSVVVIGHIVDDAGFEYDVARTGKEALQKWEDSSYRIILMDIQMPEMDGFTATREIRKREEEGNLPRTPIIGMTAHALVGDKDKCIEAGMDAYLPKPIVEDDLRAEIRRYTRKAA